MWCILIPVLVGVISAILGYLLGKLTKNENNETENNEDADVNLYKNRISILQADLEACKKSKTTPISASSGAGNASIDSSMMATNLTAKTTDTSSSTPTPTSTSTSTSTSNDNTIIFNAAAAKAAFGKNIKENDLTAVEGIGPKIKELFHNHDVKTWSDLANCTVEKCQSILNSGGERFKIHKPFTWPKQSRLAAEGKWQELKDWQDQLDGGK